FFDAAGDIFDTVQFPRATEQYPLRSKGIYLCHGRVLEELGYICVSISWLERQETQGDPRFVNQRQNIAKVGEDGNGLVLR
ncbi:hypothetical protein, partial [Longispora fulva]